MSTLQLKEKIYSVGVLNPALRVFDIIMTAEYGTSYNAYLIKGEKTALVETVHESFFDEYLENLQNLCDVTKIDYLIMNHTEPDHSGSIHRLLALCPGLEIISSVAAQKYLTSIVNVPFRSRIVKQGDTLDLGGMTLSFHPSPFLHWPDSMFTYESTTKTVFTCDFLGAHYCEPRVFDRFVHYPVKYEEAFRYYYDCIFGPFKPYVLAGLDKLAALEFDMVCPSHGPVLTDTIGDKIEKYRLWSTPKEKGDKKTVVIVYGSAYGYTKQLALASAQALEEAGYCVKSFDVVEDGLAEIIKAVEPCDALLIGSNTINRDATKPVWDVLTSIDAINTRKPAGAFGSFGWSGEAVPMIQTRLSQLKFNVVGEGFKINFRPTDIDKKNCADYALEVAAQIK
ncbi:MAG: MBL fold hydrolase [Clostridiales bacterium 43-6]|nr:MAG: MBL fold hydrolase [Clostridiales bacterium 43-6]